jgi:hypothetical protein
MSATTLTFAAAALHLVLLGTLHLIKPGLDPSWRMISEYAIGDYGWLMSIAFLSMAVSFVALFTSLRPQLRTRAGRIGLGLLLVSAVGLTIAGLFTTDPITASPESMTTSGQLHQLGGTIGISMPFAVTLVTLSLARNPRWSSSRSSLLWTAALVWVALIVFFVTLGAGLSATGGKFGPDVPIGWPNRLLVVAYSVWLMTVSWRAMEQRHRHD